MDITFLSNLFSLFSFLFRSGFTFFDFILLFTMMCVLSMLSCVIQSYMRGYYKR